MKHSALGQNTAQGSSKPSPTPQQTPSLQQQRICKIEHPTLRKTTILQTQLLPGVLIWGCCSTSSFSLAGEKKAPTLTSIAACFQKPHSTGNNSIAPLFCSPASLFRLLNPQMEPDAVMEDPLPAPSSAIMAMFLGESGGPAAAASPPQPAPAAAPAPTAADTAQAPSTAQEQPQPAQAAPRGPTPPPAQQQLQQAAPQKAGMSRLDYETCAAMHSILAKYKEADPFRQPVDVEGLGIPDYYDVIKTPMDLKTVRDKVRACWCVCASTACC